MGLSFSDCKERFLYSTIPIAPAIKMCLLTTDLTLRSFFLYSQRDQCRIFPRGGLPRDASCKEVQLPSSEFCSSLKYCFLFNLTVDSFTSLINSLEKRLAALVYPYSQAYVAIFALLSGVKWPKFPRLRFQYFLIVSKTCLLPTWTNWVFFLGYLPRRGQATMSIILLRCTGQLWTRFGIECFRKDIIKQIFKK